MLLAGFAQVYALLAPLLTRMAAIYGTFVAFFAILAWLSISFNLLLFGRVLLGISIGGFWATAIALSGRLATNDERRAYGPGLDKNATSPGSRRADPPGP